MRTFARPLSALVSGAVAVTAAVVPLAPAVAAPTPAYAVGGYVPGTTVVTAASRSAQIRDAEDLPASVDLRADAPAVGNQGNVGACVAWTIGYSIMGYYAKGSGEPYAPLYLYLRAVKGAAPNTGLVPENALTEAQKYGVDTQSDYFQGTLNYSVKPTSSEVANASNYRITGWKALWSGVANQGTTGQLAIERALAAGNPVAIGFPVFRDFQSLKANSTYNTLSGTSLGGHMVTAYGYDSEGVWIRNQWSTAWGTNGDAKLSWAFVNKLVSAAYTVNGITVAEKPTVPAPTVVSLSSRTGSTVGGDTVTITGTGLDTATAVKFGPATATFTTTKVDGATRLVATVPASTAGAADVTVTSPTGSSSASAATKYRYVAPRPTVTGLSASTSVIFGGSTVTLTGTALTGAKSVKVGSAAATAVTVTSDTTLTFVVPKVARAGAAHVVVTTAGGASATSATDVLTYVNPPAPVVTGLSVASGKAKGTTPVTITGTDLLGVSAVLLDGKRITFTAVSPTQVRIVVPQHAAGSANVQVTTPGGTSAPGEGNLFTWVS
ncbi:IPT/TIG domain-containing protein [Cryptosporangium arvum]|uniref:IPT/TIG domain-containing protein n=1 Tax=Cryptosporangium arvum TaxID=80871 RepID=UPI0004B6C9DE|nr:IPT/TIG domain-containing protein [Cryptosporangium arvum]